MKSQNKINLRFLAFAALLAALDIVTLRLLSVYTYLPPGTFLFRLSLQHFWYALAGWITGPGWAMAMAMCSDLISSFINPTGTGVVYPGYTLTAGLSGMAYGLILFRSKANIPRCILSVFSHVVVIGLPLTSLWNYLQGYYPSFWAPFWLAAPWRIGASIPMAALLYGLLKVLEKPYESLGYRTGVGQS